MLDRFTRDPLGFLGRLAHEQGDLARFRVGKRDVFLVTDPELTREVLVTRHRLFAKQRFVPAGSRVPPPRPGLMMSEDPRRHVQGRRLVQPAFAKERLETFVSMAREEVERAASGWRDGAVIDVRRELALVSVETVGRTLFGGRFGDDAPHVFADARTILAAFRLVVSRGSQAVDLLRLRRGLDFVAAHRRLLDAQASRLASARDGRGDDVPSLLAAAGEGIADRDRAAEAFAIFLAGIDTTSVALAWACYLLAAHPGEAERLRAEPGRAEQVFAETLRLYPPSWYIGRRALTNVELAGAPVRAGSIVLLSPYLVQRDPRWYDHPDLFDPDRWVGGTSRRRAQGTFFPFGSGARQCLGERLAWIAADAALTAITERWRLECVEGEPEPVPEAGPSLAPRKPLRLRLVSLRGVV